MDTGKLKKYRQQLRSRVPLLGGWLQGQALRTLIQDGSAEAVRVLEEGAVQSEDEALRATALESLRQMAQTANVAAQEALCRLVINHDHRLAHKIVAAAGYLPHEESHRALFYFLTDQWKSYEALDFDHRLLREAYQTADESLRSRIAAKARQAGRLEWVDLVSGGRQARRLGLMTDEEWRTALKLLEANQRLAELWKLAQEAPPRWSAAGLRQLKKARWRPREEERLGFEELTGLATGWPEKRFRRLFYHRLMLQGHTREVRCLAISPSGKMLVSGSADRSVRLWGLPQGRLLKTLTGHSAWVNCLAISRDGRVLASAGRDCRICLWRLPGGHALGKLKGHEQAIFCLAMTPDSKVLASGSSDDAIRLWSLPDGRLLKTLEGHEGGITCLAVSPDGRLLVSGSGDSTLRVWSLPDGRALKTLEGHLGGELRGVLCLALGPDGRLLASGGTDSRIFLWQLPDGRLLKTLNGHADQVGALVISPDGKRLISGAADSGVRLWRLPGGRPLQVLDGQSGANGCMVLSPDGQLLACSGGGLGIDHSVRLWNLRGQTGLRILQGHSRYVTCLAMSPDGQLLASGSGDSTIRLWSAELARLGQLPTAKASLKDLEWVQAMCRDETLSQAEQRAFTFLEALFRWRRRLDILVDEAAPRIMELGAFDIEIEG